MFLQTLPFHFFLQAFLHLSPHGKKINKQALQFRYVNEVHLGSRKQSTPRALDKDGACSMFHTAGCLLKGGYSTSETENQVDLHDALKKLFGSSVKGCDYSCEEHELIRWRKP